MSRVRSNESNPISVLESLFDDVSDQRHSDTLLDEATLGLKLLVQAFDDYTMNTIEPTTSLSLIYLEVID